MSYPEVAGGMSSIAASYLETSYKDLNVRSGMSAPVYRITYMMERKCTQI